TLSLKDLKDDIATATTAAGTFTLNAVIPEDPEITSLNPTNGEEAGGTVVTITGSNFIVGTAATVMFGTNEASEVNVASATSISCKSPVGTSTVNVTVTQDSRTSNAVQFTYDPPSTNEMTLKAEDVSGDPEDEVIIPINISDISAAFDSDAFGFTLKYDSNVLSFVSVEKTGTLVEPFTMVNGSENTPGEVKVSGAYFGAKASIDNGLFVNIKVQVKADASTNTSLVLTELKDDIADATTSAGTFTVNAVGGMSLKAGDVSGEPEDEVIIPINISDISAAFDSDAFGFTLKYDSNVLSFVSVEKTGTLVEPFTMVNGSENTPGEVKVSGAYFGAKASIDNGLFVNIKVQVKADASTNTSLVLTELKDDIADATTSAGTFTVNVNVQDPVISSINPTNGAEAGDTIVTITGSNFIVGTAATVMFGANEATEVNVVSTTEISCKSPAGTGTVDVTVTQESRTSNAVQFTYNPVVSEMTLKAGDVSGDPEDEVIIPIN
ncbi:Cell surface receptor IPT/TIG domain protein, partial [Candidatus Magnetomorum sp. HK-1]